MLFFVCCIVHEFSRTHSNSLYNTHFSHLTMSWTGLFFNSAFQLSFVRFVSTTRTLYTYKIHIQVLVSCRRRRKRVKLQVKLSCWSFLLWIYRTNSSLARFRKPHLFSVVLSNLINLLFVICLFSPVIYLFFFLFILSLFL